MSSGFNDFQFVSWLWWGGLCRPSCLSYCSSAWRCRFWLKCSSRFKAKAAAGTPEPCACPAWRAVSLQAGTAAPCVSSPSTLWCLPHAHHSSSSASVRQKVSMAQELGHNRMGIPGLLLMEKYQLSPIWLRSPACSLSAAWSFLSVPWISSPWFICTWLALGCTVGWECQCNSFRGKKKICSDFQAEIVILFLENRAINSADAKQTLCNVCIKVGWGSSVRKGWYLSLTCLSVENALVFMYWLLDFHPACILASLFAQMNSDLKTAKLSRKIFPFQLST